MQAYLQRLVVGSDALKTQQVKLDKVLPIKNNVTVEAARPISSQEANTSAYKTLRNAWVAQRFAGIRAKRAAAKAEAGALKKESK